MAIKWSAFSAADAEGGALQVVGLQDGANVRADAETARALIGVDEAVAAHAAAPDPHPGYVTAPEGDAAYEALGAVAAHAAASNPHPGYLTPAEGDAAYEPLGEAAAAIAAHEAASDPHPTYQRESEKGQANGYASLDSSSLVPAAQLARAWPVGSVFVAVVSTNPATLLGYGTWSAFAAGRVIVGLDSGDTDFDTVEETGGAKTVTLSEAQIPSHTHVQNSHNHTQDAHTHTQNSHNHTQDAHTHTQNAHNHVITSQTATTGGATSYEHGTLDTSSADAEASEVTADATAVNQNATATNQAATATNQNATATNQAATATNQNTGGGGAHSNVQPYIVVYMWKRVV